MRDLFSMGCMEAFFAVIVIYKEMKYCLFKQALRLGLSVLELQVLWIAANFKGVTLNDLAIVTTCSKEELEVVLNFLESEGLAKKVRSGNAGKRIIEVTPEGKDLLEEVPSLVTASCSLECIDSETLQTFRKGAFKLVNAFGGWKIVEMLNQQEKHEKKE